MKNVYKVNEDAVKKIAERVYDNGSTVINRNDLEEMFPELKKESEDERIRKEIISAVNIYCSEYSRGAKVREDMLAWLEKQGEQRSKLVDFDLNANDSDLQDETYFIPNGFHAEIIGDKVVIKKGEQKPVEKVEPKFKVGDWVVDRNGTVQQILSYKDCIYKHTNGYSSKMFEDEWRMWNVAKDAKDGDVLATDDGNIFVFDGTVEEAKYPFAYYGLTRRRFESYDRRLPFTHNNVHPATKEQRDTLMKAMADAGYTFDFEKKELKRIEQKSVDNILTIVD